MRVMPNRRRGPGAASSRGTVLCKVQVKVKLYQRRPQTRGCLHTLLSFFFLSFFLLSSFFLSSFFLLSFFLLSFFLLPFFLVSFFLTGGNGGQRGATGGNGRQPRPHGATVGRGHRGRVAPGRWGRGWGGDGGRRGAAAAPRGCLVAG